MTLNIMLDPAHRQSTVLTQQPSMLMATGHNSPREHLQAGIQMATFRHQNSHGNKPLPSVSRASGSGFSPLRASSSHCTVSTLLHGVACCSFFSATPHRPCASLRVTISIHHGAFGWRLIPRSLMHSSALQVLVWLHGVSATCTGGLGGGLVDQSAPRRAFDD